MPIVNAGFLKHKTFVHFVFFIKIQQVPRHIPSTPQEPRHFPSEPESSDMMSLVSVFSFMGQKTAVGGLVVTAFVSISTFVSQPL